MATPTSSLGPLTAQLKNDAGWLVYPAMQEYADECERLLTFLPPDPLKRFWSALKNCKEQRLDETLNEIRIAWFLDSLGYPILDWDQPVDAPPQKTEFSISLPGQLKAFVEVKSRGWESELSKAELDAGRAQKPKYLDEDEAEFTGPVDAITAAVKKAHPKFSGKFPTIVFVSDDLKVNILEWGEIPIKTALFEGSYGPTRIPGMFSTTDYETVGAVCIFRVKTPIGPNGVDYECVCEANPKALPTCKIPPDVVANLNKGRAAKQGA